MDLAHSKASQADFNFQIFPLAPPLPLYGFTRAWKVFLLNWIHISEGYLSPTSSITLSDGNKRDLYDIIDLYDLNQQSPSEYFKHFFYFLLCGGGGGYVFNVEKSFWY